VRSAAHGQARPAEHTIEHGTQGQGVLDAREVAQEGPVALERVEVLFRELRGVAPDVAFAILAAIAPEAVVDDKGPAGSPLREEARGAAVCGDHALLDEALGLEFFTGLDVIDVTSLVQHPAKLGPVVHHQFLFLAVPAQGARGLVERLEGRGVAYQRFVVAAEVAVDGVVGELRAGANLRLEKAEIADGAVLSHLQATYQRRPRLVFRQRTAAQGQGLGKHRRHGAVEVHAAAAPAHDIAQRRVGVDVGRGSAMAT
jgi:hypothetical protein